MSSPNKNLFQSLAAALFAASMFGHCWAGADDGGQPNAGATDRPAPPVHAYQFLKEDSAMAKALSYSRQAALEQSHPYLRQDCAEASQDCDSRSKSRRGRAADAARDRHACRD